MNELKYKWILYLIAGVILCTVAIQTYWNHKNYLSGKQHLMNDVQESLDNAVDKYYTLLVQKNIYPYFSNTNDSLFSIDIRGNLNKDSQLEIQTLSDSILKTKQINQSFLTTKNNNEKLQIITDSLKTITDTLKFAKKPFKTLTAKVMISFAQDSLSLSVIDSLFSLELETKNIYINHKILLKKKEDEQEFLKQQSNKFYAIANSFYIPQGNKLLTVYDNITIQVLKKNVLGILLSFILLGSVIASLLYLLKIIRHQKKLSEMKNDLISNITHEFKTPIATISVATESITGFSISDIDEKTQRYAQVTNEQVKKLNLMVEKLLETASLDSSELTLNKEDVNLNELINSSIRNQNVMDSKSISVLLPDQSINYFADAFHFENAINNVIDNALKYGGDEVFVALEKKPAHFEISIADSGTGLTEEQKDLIFDKFYRVPKGNLHDVKGFGIGLYYTKKIIEKHDGKIWVELHRDHTKFLIRLPYA